MIEWTVEFKGLAELGVALSLLADEMQDEAAREGLKRGAEVLAEGMRMRAPVAAEHRIMRRGKAYPLPLADSIGFRVLVKEGKAEIGPMKRAFWGRFQERGTKFQIAQPFMKPTVEADGEIAVAAVATGLKDKLATIVARVRRRTIAGGGTWH